MMDDDSEFASSGSVNERSPLLRRVEPVPIDPESSNDAIPKNIWSEHDVPLAEEPSTVKLSFIMGSIWVGVFFNALDSTIVATLSAPISNSFSSFTLLSWLASAYLIANAAIQPLSGRLTDIFSRRTGLVVSNILFGAGTLICGFADSPAVMILGRVVSGMGGGSLNTISTIVGSDLVPLRRRGLWQGIGNVVYGVGAGLGGVYGGWVNDKLGWRMAFLIQVPFIAVSMCLAAYAVRIPVKETDKSRLKRIDFLGAFTLVASLVLLLLGLNAGGNLVPWNHPLVLTSLPCAFALLLAFVFVEDRVASEPIIPVRLLLNRTVFSACMTNWFNTMALYALFYYAPIYFQVRGLTATQAGARLIPQSFGIAIGSLVSGIFMRWTGRYYLLHVFMQAIFLLAVVLVAATFGRNTPSWPPFVFFFMGGLGFASMLTITLLALIAAVDHADQAVITSASYAFRSTGSTIGITLASAVFQNLLKQQLWSRFGDREDASEVIGRLRDSIEEIGRLPPGWFEGVMDSYMDAFKGVWVLIVGLATLGVLVSLLMKEHVLYKNLART